MNIVETTGGIQRQRQLAALAVEWFLKHKLPRFRTLAIDIELKNLKGKIYGFCECVEPRRFTIEIQRGMSDRKMISTVLHEMIHVKQYVRNELIDIDAGKIQWKSRKFKDVDYWDQPWEREAYRYDERFTDEFIKYVHKNIF